MHAQLLGDELGALGGDGLCTHSQNHCRVCRHRSSALESCRRCGWRRTSRLATDNGCAIAHRASFRPTTPQCTAKMEGHGRSIQGERAMGQGRHRVAKCHAGPGAVSPPLRAAPLRRRRVLRAHVTETAAGASRPNATARHPWVLLLPLLIQRPNILERPFEEVLASEKPDVPYCLCGANENWTRIWDGGSTQVLLAQRHSLEDDLAHNRALIPTFKDKRYAGSHLRAQGARCFEGRPAPCSRERCFALGAILLAAT